MTVPSLGLTLACRDDFDGLFSVATSDEQILTDELYHRFTTDSVLGDTPQANDWGYDVRKLLGSPMTPGDIMALGPTLANVAQRSPLVEFCDVVVTRTSAPSNPLELKIEATGKSATGSPFAFLFTLDATNYLRVGSDE
jgi:hypothetical protein